MEKLGEDPKPADAATIKDERGSMRDAVAFALIPIAAGTSGDSGDTLCNSLILIEYQWGILSPLAKTEVGTVGTNLLDHHPVKSAQGFSFPRRYAAPFRLATAIHSDAVWRRALLGLFDA